MHRVPAREEVARVGATSIAAVRLGDGGVLAGAAMPNHTIASASLMPASASVGTSGNDATRFGMQLLEIQQIAQRLLVDDRLDYLDMSLWDVFKEPEDPALKGRSLLSYFTELDRQLSDDQLD